jgi:hypothetical protein
MRKHIRILFVLMALALAPGLKAGACTTSVNWESINGSGPRRPTLSTIIWKTTLGGSLSVKDPVSADWVDLRHVGTKRGDASLGAMFVGRCDDGRMVQVTLFGKPYYGPTRFEYALTFTRGSAERMFYGDCSSELIACFKANR